MYVEMKYLSIGTSTYPYMFKIAKIVEHWHSKSICGA